MTERVTQQQQWKRSIERSLENFKKLGRNNLTPARVRSRISLLRDVWRQFQEGHTTVLLAIPKANRAEIAYFRDNHYEMTEDAYQEAMDFMAEALEELEPLVSPPRAQSDGAPTCPTSSAQSLAPLPRISLPPFNGNLDEWEQFRDRFLALIVQNPDLGDFARMHFLISCVKGPALECIGSIPVTASNFDIAWRALVLRYENKCRLLQLHLSTLLNLPVISRESASELQSLSDRVHVAISSLAKLPRSPDELWNDVLVHIVVQRLDPVTRKAWKLKTTDSNEPPSFERLTTFIASRARALEELTSSSSAKSTQRNASISKVSVATAAASPAFQCPVCKSRHYFSACPTFVRGNEGQRRELAKKHGRCFNCLSQSHSVKTCKSRYSCRLCHQRHHTMLHAGSGTSDSTPGDSAPGPSAHSGENKNEVQSLLASHMHGGRTPVLLATAVITVGGADGRSVRARALLDQGSEMTFISERLAQSLQAPRFRMPTSVSAVGCVRAGTFRYAAVISVSPRDSGSPTLTTHALILKSLTSYTPKRIAGVGSLSHFADLRWADPDPSGPDPIQLILGADLYSEIILGGVRKGEAGQPMAQNSIFGWVISGPISAASPDATARAHASVASPSAFQISTHHCLGSIIEDDLKRFWEVEELPNRYISTPEDDRCETHFRATHSRVASGRYVVRLPFRDNPPIKLGDTRCRAEKLLNSILRRLIAGSERWTAYRDFLDEYERLGHMRRVSPSTDTVAEHVYLPHHPVFRETSATTRLRVVFNASSTTSAGVSLNDKLLVGPKLQTDLPAVIMRWRQFRFVYSADIEKMYRQILVDSRDIDCQRILWKTSVGEPASEFQLLTVTYGMACAPFLALRVLRQLTCDEGAPFPSAVTVLRNNIYVDDVLFGHEDMTALVDIRDQLISLLRRGGFELRKWASNSSALLSDIDADHRGVACDKSLTATEQLSILGIGWNPGHDAFQVRVALGPEVPQTKRTILSAIARLYDPLGWITPVVVSAKIIMQQLWRAGLQWDDVVPEVIRARWTRVYAGLSKLDGLRVSRWSGFGPDVQAELHGFADASNVAYAAAVYLRVINRSGRATVTLIVGKSRVAPVKPVSIPRLELLGAVLLARLIEFSRETLEIRELPCLCWTDSTVVLAWLKQHPSRWKTFVANRVADVQSRLPGVEWRHVRTEDNPADCASRGLFGDDLIDHALWWRGPPWLPFSRDQWPPTHDHVVEGVNLEEKVTTLQVSPVQPGWDLATRFSSWPKLVRVTAYIMKFVSLCRRIPTLNQATESQGMAISSQYCEAAKMFWYKQIQAELFAEELRLLANRRTLPSKHPMLALGPFIDGAGLLRVGGRLNRASSPLAARHPILLASHALVILIIDNVHIRSLHAGLQLTLSTLRREFWIFRARSMVKSVIHRCIPCIRERAAVPTQLMGDLPAVRVTAPPRSFIHCGLDYAGPVAVRASAGRGIASRKAYIALFVCLATRAIHLEVVVDYSTAAFLNAYLRFCSRRGMPQSIYSDNGTTFVGANRELAAAYRAALRDPNFQNKTSTDNVSWHFIPPSAPHFGGIWEAGVRSVKHHLRRVLGDHALTYEEFGTLLCRVEACLNSRPIAPLSDNLDDYECLTPGHFLIGSALTAPPEPSLLNLRENRLSRWQLIRQISERFWRLWYCDYVNTLHQRTKWRSAQPSIEVGALVLLKNPNMPPCKWELGRVTRCHPGQDGLVRVVTVKTAASEYTRPIGKLCRLPVDSEATPA